MKKNRIFSVGILAAAALVLSACTVTVGGPTLENKEIRTSWHIAGESTNFVVCENQDTAFEVRFDYLLPERIADAHIKITGVSNSNWTYSTVVDGAAMSPDADHDVVFDFTLRSDVSPYPMAASSDLDTAAIIIRPLPPEAVPAEGGAQIVTVTIRDSRGARIGTFSDRFDVWGGCTP